MRDKATNQTINPPTDSSRRTKRKDLKENRPDLPNERKDLTMNTKQLTKDLFQEGDDNV
jgi:hypothetical protein